MQEHSKRCTKKRTHQRRRQRGAGTGKEGVKTGQGWRVGMVLKFQT